MLGLNRRGVDRLQARAMPSAPVQAGKHGKTKHSKIEVGARVQIHGMQRAVHFNGRKGLVKSQLHEEQDAEGQRFGVEVDDYGGIISFSLQNLELYVPSVKAIDPWKVLEKASEDEAEAAAREARQVDADKRKARASERGFNKGYKS